jgi:uncharacterized repeat protein (TIGR03806 family)
LESFKSAWRAVALGAVLAVAPAAWAQAPGAYGISSWVAPKAYLNMPRHLAGAVLPSRLSQTGAFSDTARMVPTTGLIPYDLIVPFWSDGATKARYMALPPGAQIGSTPEGEWTFPAGTVFIKTFELHTDDSHPDARRRLETRLLVRDDQGGVYGVTYKWRPDNTDADLLPSSQIENVAIRGRDGATHEQPWYYPSRENCLTCHNTHTTGVLGVKARQLNRTMTYPSGVSDNELRTLNHLGVLHPSLTDSQLQSVPTLAGMADTSRSIEDRARSYLDANCGHCHRPGGTVAYFDARYSTPLPKQELIDGPILINEGIDRPHPIAPHDIWRSIIFMRADTNGDIRMPPIARQTIDTQGMQLLQDWITSLPGKDVLVPPKIMPDGGTFATTQTVTLSSPDAGAQIHYTVDGSVPGPDDPIYSMPITVSGPTVLRARAYKDGMTRSITAESVFIVGQQ